MKTCNQFLRQVLGLRILNLLDDFLFAYYTAPEAMRKGNLMVKTLEEFGWLIHDSKCKGLKETLTVVEGLGSGINLVTQRFTLLPGKITAILQETRALLMVARVKANHMARVKGLLASTWLALGSHARIRTRSMDKVIESRLQEGDDPTAREPWRRTVLISSAARAELSWFDRYLEPLGMVGRPFRESTVTFALDGIAASDASADGYGGWVALDERHSTDKLIENLRSQADGTLSVCEARRHAIRSSRSPV